MFEPWKPNMSHGVLPFKVATDGNPSDEARDGYAWITLPFREDEILASFPAAAGPSLCQGDRGYGSQPHLRETIRAKDASRIPPEQLLSALLLHVFTAFTRKCS
jgi:hypothetical protein